MQINAKVDVVYGTGIDLKQILLQTSIGNNNNNNNNNKADNDS